MAVWARLSIVVAMTALGPASILPYLSYCPSYPGVFPKATCTMGREAVVSDHSKTVVFSYHLAAADYERK